TASSSGGGITAAPVSDPGIHKIKHFVLIVQENRSFDSYFGTYPRADGIPGLAGHPGQVPCLPDPGRHCARPFHDRADLNGGGPHNAPASVADINHGKMNGFVTELHAHGCKSNVQDDP